MIKCQVALWICSIKQLCLQTILKSVNGLSTLAGDRVRFPEACSPVTGSYNLFSAQLAASVALSVLVLYGHISTTRTHCGRHYSGTVVAEILNIRWCHIEDFCDNPNEIPLQNQYFFSRGFVKIPSHFTDRIQLIINNLTNFVHMIIETTGWIKQDTEVPWWSLTWWNG